MSFAPARVRVEAALASWTYSRIAWPDQDFVPPQPSADPATPAEYIAVEIYENSAALCDFTGGKEVQGRVAIWIWTEKRAGDDLVRTRATALETAFAAADGSGVFFLAAELGDARLLGEPQTWYGRQLSIPFTQFR